MKILKLNLNDDASLSKITFNNTELLVTKDNFIELPINIFRNININIVKSLPLCPRLYLYGKDPASGVMARFLYNSFVIHGFHIDILGYDTEYQNKFVVDVFYNAASINIPQEEIAEYNKNAQLYIFHKDNLELSNGSETTLDDILVSNSNMPFFFKMEIEAKTFGDIVDAVDYVVKEIHKSIYK